MSLTICLISAAPGWLPLLSSPLATKERNLRAGYVTQSYHLHLLPVMHAHYLLSLLPSHPTGQGTTIAGSTRALHSEQSLTACQLLYCDEWAGAMIIVKQQISDDE